MKEGSSYPTDQALAVLLLGDAGAGKTNLAMKFPDPWFLNIDDNLRDPILRNPGKQFWYDSPNLDDKGRVLPKAEVWPRCVELLKVAGADPKVKTIVIDSLSTFTDVMKDFIIAKGSQMEKPIVVGGEMVMNRSLWEPFGVFVRNVIREARSYGKLFVMIAHLKKERSEVVSGDVAMEMTRLLPGIQGAMDEQLAQRFTDVWRMEARPAADGTSVNYILRTAPTSRLTCLKCSCGLPVEVQANDVTDPATGAVRKGFTWEGFQKHQEGRKRAGVAATGPGPVAPIAPK